jgi:hypothetical protein
MIQNIYTNFILSKQQNKQKNKQKKNQKKKRLSYLFNYLSAPIFVMLPQRRPYTTYTITVVKIGNISVVINVTKTR